MLGASLRVVVVAAGLGDELMGELAGAARVERSAGLVRKGERDRTHGIAHRQD